MLKIIKWFFGLFVPYVNGFEWKVDRFFRGIKSTDSISSVRVDLLKLMQKNLVVVDLWMEKKYKGYVGLSKRVRRAMYFNILAIVNKFHEYGDANPVSKTELSSALSGVMDKVLEPDRERLTYIYSIMRFLKPGKYYNYIPTASFGKLLRDPNTETLEGDCNQIVTLYIYLYSLKYPITDLNIKLLPEHVCLHFHGVDIEATNGSFQKYTECREVLPITEILATNLLDLSDFRENVRQISPRDMVKSAQLAYAVSSLRDMVHKNLMIAYHNLAVEAMKTNDFSSAKFFAGEAKDADLLRSIKHNEGIYFYKSGGFEYALRIFEELGDSDMKKACYGGMFNKLQSTVSVVKTHLQAVQYRSTYVKMRDLARKMGDSHLEQELNKVLKDL